MTRKNRTNPTLTAAVLSIAIAAAYLPLVLTVNAKPEIPAEPATIQMAQPVQTAKASAPASTIPVIIETTPAETETPETQEAEPQAPALDPYEVELIGRTIWGEAMGVKSKAERAAVAWCILNRVDAWGQSVKRVVTAPDQFQGYRYWGECPQEHIDLAADVMTRWLAEKAGAEDVGRTLPADHLYFMGFGGRNHFTTEFLGTNYWGWSMADPYK